MIINEGSLAFAKRFYGKFFKHTWQFFRKHIANSGKQWICCENCYVHSKELPYFRHINCREERSFCYAPSECSLNNITVDEKDGGEGGGGGVKETLGGG